MAPPTVLPGALGRLVARASARLASLSGWRADLAAALLGALSAASLPPLHLIPVLLVSFPGLLVLIGATQGWHGAARRGFWFGFGLHVPGLYWITEAILLESARYWWLVPLAVPSLAALLALFIAAACAITRLAAPDRGRRALMLAGAWVLADLARQFVGTGFPWNPLGSVWAVPGSVGDVMIQPAAWIGTPGLTGATVMLATLPLAGWRAGLFCVAALAAWMGLGAWRLGVPDGAPPGLDVVLAQGNVAQGQKWDREIAVETFRRYLDLTRSGIARATARAAATAAAAAAPSEGGSPGRPAPGQPRIVVVWPETASVFLLTADADARRYIADAAEPAVATLAGSLRFPRGMPSLEADNKPHNSLVAVTASGVAIGAYDKWHLVPFGEYAPSWVPFAVQVVPGQFGFGRGPATLHVPGLPPVGPMICYEAIFPAQVVDQADRPDWMVNVTNDAWFGDSAGPRQHLAAARLRAVEEGLPLMRAANTGITVGFDAKGRELARLPMNLPGTLVLSLPGKRPPTSFSRWGLVIPGVLAVLACGAGFGIGRKRRA